MGWGVIQADRDRWHDPYAILFRGEETGLLKEVATMKLMVTIDRDEDGVWVVECPSVPGCVSQGQTKEEALDNIREAIALCMEVRAEQGWPLTIETQQVEVAL